jgi:hypothetical protein
VSAGVDDTLGGEFRHLAERNRPLDDALVQVVRGLTRRAQDGLIEN